MSTTAYSFGMIVLHLYVGHIIFYNANLKMFNNDNKNPTFTVKDLFHIYQNNKYTHNLHSDIDGIF